jgi:hypothetical protein
MRRIIFTSFLLLFQIAGCKESNEVPSKIITIDSSIDNGYKGFHFETGKTITYPNSDNIKPDFSVLVQIEQTGFIVGPFLSNPDLTSIFALTATFTDKEQADDFFDNYTVASATNYDPVALNLEPYQVWTIKTNHGEYAKLLVLDTDKVMDINNPFAEVTFRWDFVN